MKKQLLLAGSLLILLLISLICGRYSASAWEAASAFVHGSSSPLGKILFQIRLPRILFVVLAGASLSVCGSIFQTIFKNPLASGDIIGASSGCSLGAAIAILCFADAWGTWFSAFLGGMSAIFGCLLLAHRMHGNRILNYVVSGLIIQAIATSALMMIKLTADPYQQLGSIEFWLMGGFANIGWNNVALLAPCALILLWILYRLRWKIQLLAFGKEGETLGNAPVFLTVIVLTLSSLLISAIIASAGIVSWVSLLVPHMVRIAFHQNFMQSYVYNILVGAIFLLIADTLARCLFTIEIPISIITSLFGAAFLVFLFIKGKINI